MYNNFSSKKTKKVISALLASALVVTSAPITANAATVKKVGVGKSITYNAKATVKKVTVKNKKVVKATKKGKKVTIKGLKAGTTTVTVKTAKKTIKLNVKVGATKIAKKTMKNTMTAGTSQTVSVTATGGKGDTIKFASSNKAVLTVNKTSAKASTKGIAKMGVKAVSEGTAKLTATSKNTGVKKAFTIKVVAATPAPATQAPATGPAVTTAAATNAPSVATTPAVQTTAPAGTDAASTENPDATKDPNATQDPNATKDPNATQNPDATQDPNATQNPDATQDPNATQNPEATTTPAITATPEATATPATHAAVVVSVAAVVGDKSVTLPGTDVAANSSVYVTFDKDMDATTIATGNITVIKDGIKQLASVTYNSAKKAAVITLKDALFEAGATYTIKINGLKDKDGYSVAAYTTTFTVSTTPIIKTATFEKKTAGTQANGSDATFTTTKLDGAVIDGISYLDVYDAVSSGAGRDGAYTAAQDTYKTDREIITLTFNKDMNTSSLADDAKVKIYDVTANQYLTKSLSAIDKNTVDVTIMNDNNQLQTGHEYKMTVTGMSSLDGTVMADQTYKFFYGISAPTFVNDGVSYQSVSANNVTYAYNTNTAATPVYGYLTAHAGYSAFSFKGQLNMDVDTETINNNTVVMTNKVTGDIIDTTVAYEAGSRYIIVTPAKDLAEETTYEVKFDGIKTDKGLAMAKTVYTFTTGDFAAPTVVSITPENGTDEVPLNKTITINFSEGMASSSLDTTTIKFKDLTENQDLTYTTYYSPALSQDGKTYTLTSIKDLEVGHTYQLTVKGDGFTAGVTDDSGNYLTADVVVKFATVNPTSTYLTAVQANAATYDKDDAKLESGVKAFDDDKKLYFTFDKAVVLTNATLTVEKKAVGATVWSTETTCTAVDSTNNNNKTVEVTLPTTNGGKWQADTLYKITLSGLKDVNGNDVAEQTFQFTVGTKPSLAATNPEGFAKDVALDEKYIFAAIEDTESDLDVSTLNVNTVKVVKKGDQSATPYTFTAAQYEKVTTAIDSSVASSSVSANGTNSAYSDITVNAGSDYSIGQLIRLYDGSADKNYYGVVVDNTQSTTITINTNVTAIANAFDIYPAQGVVYTLNDDAKLDANSQYQIVISGVQDRAGNEVDAVTKAFTTKADTQNLKFVSSSIKDNDAGVAVNQAITLTFNENLDVSNAVNKALSDVITITDNGSDKTPNFTITQDNGVVTITPKAFMKAGTVYQIKVDKTVATSEYNGASTVYLAKDEIINFQTETKASVTPKIVSAVCDIDAKTIVLTLNSAVGSGVTTDNINVDGVSAAPTSVTPKNGGKTVVLSYGSLPTGFAANASKISLVEGTAKATDLFGNVFSTDEVVVTK